MTSHGGAKVGTRIAIVVSQAIVSTHAKMAAMKHKLAMAIFHSISDVISEEVHDTLGPLFRQFHADLPEGSQAHDLLDFMAHNRGQLQAMAGMALTSGGILSSLAQVINNELASSVRANLASNPHGIPDPTTFAALAAKGQISNDEAIRGIGENGIAYGFADPLIQASYQMADATTLLDFLRRGLIDDAIFQTLGRNAGIRQDVLDLIRQTREIPLSPADAALALLRGNIDQSAAERAAATWGVSPETFSVLVGNTGEPLGLMQLLEAYRRGFIDEPTLEKGIRESRIRNEWIPVAKQLRYSPMSISDAARAVVQNQIPFETGASYAQQNGLEADSFKILVATEGNPLSRTEMEDLYNRGKATKEDVLQASRESHLKDKYGELAFELHERLIPVGTVSDAVLYGAISHQDAISKVMEHGFSDRDAAIIVSAASNRKLETFRQAVVSATEQLYVDNAIDKGSAVEIAVKMGFDANEASVIFESAEYKRQARIKNAAVNAVRNKYIMHHTTENETSGFLDALGITANERDELLAIWTVERNANVRVLTPAQIVKAFNMQLIDSEDAAIARLVQLGYTQQDATLLLKGA